MTAPIDPHEYLYGVKVVDIGDLRIARGLTRRPIKTCRHLRLTYDERERRVYCNDCETDVEPFDAFIGLVQFHDGASKKIRAEHKAAQEAARYQVRGRAAKAMDEAWRKQKSVPLCPHCKEGILPEDVLPAPPAGDKKWALAKRNRDKKP
ncbi:hypothetical protein SAMN05216198_1516 [Halopseudomonas litoralis]|uniref:Uncharacterized protein n=1 Tax=Halopseudomonas litoralis TaxID=797277 RepID=A0A1H1QL29_9GAMM|nr:hypothetical protein [Halopseudomonas litoralis]SDS24160.1 hypothetical protein SAMN05216198_1516 [Halopseudomonas litoralis]